MHDLQPGHIVRRLRTNPNGTRHEWIYGEIIRVSEKTAMVEEDGTTRRHYRSDLTPVYNTLYADRIRRDPNRPRCNDCGGPDGRHAPLCDTRLAQLDDDL